MIECVPDSKSHDQLGKQTQVSLKQYFNSVYGHENSLYYQEVYDLKLLTTVIAGIHGGSRSYAQFLLWQVV